MASAATALMFIGDQCGRAREAIELYTSTIPDAEVIQITEIADEAMGTPGHILQAEIRIAGTRVLLSDNAHPHEFTMTPAISLWLDLTDDAELEAVHGALVDGGFELMPLGDYGFSRRFGWVQDRFGVTWQLNLPHR